MIKIERNHLLTNAAKALTDLLNQKRETSAQSRLLAKTLKTVYKKILKETEALVEKMEDIKIEFGSMEKDEFVIKQDHINYKKSRKALNKYKAELVEIDCEPVKLDDLEAEGIVLEPVYLIVLDEIIV